MQPSETKLPKTILAVLAHPDDEAFGMGGTLALYASRGVKVYLATATLGEVGEVPEGFLKPGENLGQLREAELDCSAQALGIERVFKLGYRDSGMPGSPENQHPNALAAQLLEAVAAKVAEVMRETRPQIVLTFDPIGGYRHPDHMRIHDATVAAFNLLRAEMADRDGSFLQGLYFHTIPKTYFRLGILLTRLQGKDPRKAGANGDIDMVAIAQQTFPTHVRINYRPVMAKSAQAAACHASQGGGRKPNLLERLLDRPVNSFMQAYPQPQPGQKIRGDFFLEQDK